MANAEKECRELVVQMDAIHNRAFLLRGDDRAAEREQIDEIIQRTNKLVKANERARAGFSSGYHLARLTILLQAYVRRFGYILTP